MDVVTVIRTAVRRWYVFLPVLVLAVFAATRTANQIPPVFASEASVTVLPPAQKTISTGRPAETLIQPVNPYLSLDPRAQEFAASALQASLTSEAFISSLDPALYDPDFTVLKAEDQPILTLRSVAPVAERSHTTVQMLLAISAKQLEDLQRSAGAPPDQLLKLQVVSQSGPTQETSKRERALLVLNALSLAAAVLAATAAEAAAVSWSRRRRERRPSPPAPEVDTYDDDLADEMLGPRRDEVVVGASWRNGSQRPAGLDPQGPAYGG